MALVTDIYYVIAEHLDYNDRKNLAEYTEQKYRPNRLKPERYTFLEANFNKYPMDEYPPTNENDVAYIVIIPIKRRCFMQIVIIGHDTFQDGISEYCEVHQREHPSHYHFTYYNRDGSCVTHRRP